MATETAIVKAEDVGKFAALAMPAAERAELIKTNLGSEGIVVNDLDRMTLPAGDNLVFKIPSLDDSDYRAEFTGVLIAHKLGRARWKDEIGEGDNVPPDCSSVDCETGVGDPGGNCHGCPFAEWGSAVKDGQPSTGQACAKRHHLYIMLPDSLLPIHLDVSPGSLKAVKRAMQKLIRGNVFHYAILARFGLKAAKNAQGKPYGELTITWGDRLPPDLVARFKEMKEEIEPDLDVPRTPRVKAADIIDPPAEDGTEPMAGRNQRR